LGFNVFDPEWLQSVLGVSCAKMQHFAGLNTKIFATLRLNGESQEIRRRWLQRQEGATTEIILNPDIFQLISQRN